MKSFRAYAQTQVSRKSGCCLGSLCVSATKNATDCVIYRDIIIVVVAIVIMVLKAVKSNIRDNRLVP